MSSHILNKQKIITTVDCLLIKNTSGKSKINISTLGKLLGGALLRCWEHELRMPIVAYVQMIMEYLMHWNETAHNYSVQGMATSQGYISIHMQKQPSIWTTVNHEVGAGQGQPEFSTKNWWSFYKPSNSAVYWSKYQISFLRGHVHCSNIIFLSPITW